MKKILLTTIIITIIAFSSSFANEPVKSDNNLNRETVISNLLEGLNSENTGLKVSSAYYLGEYKSSEAVIPLMKIFHTDTNESIRIAAALSLMKIGDERGIKTLKYAGEYDDSPKVKKMCSKFYAYAKTEK